MAGANMKPVRGPHRHRLAPSRAAVGVTGRTAVPNAGRATLPDARTFGARLPNRAGTIEVGFAANV